jgi:hypothetical protein
MLAHLKNALLISMILLAILFLDFSNDFTKPKPITEDTFNTICVIINTSDACCTMCRELVLAIKKEIQPQYLEKVEIKAVFDNFETYVMDKKKVKKEN